MPMYEERMWELCILVQIAAFNCYILIKLVEPVR
jgi:hypothetical protein